MEPLIIKDFPLPPSVNTMLMPVMGAMRRNKAGKVYAAGRMVKSKEHTSYAKLCDQWALRYRSGIDAFKRELQRSKELSESNRVPFCLNLEVFYMFHVEHILTVNNKVEQKDVDNLNKAAVDNLFRIIGIDDKHIFRIAAEKCITDGHECCLIKISPYKVQKKSEILNNLGIK